MFIKIMTDSGVTRVINTDQIQFIDDGDKACLVYLVGYPDFPVRVGMSLDFFLKVLNKENDFFDLYQENEKEVLTPENNKEEIEEVVEIPAKPKKAPSFSKKAKKNETITKSNESTVKKVTAW